ncbi:UNVERIFIED_CONTAM: hypothetical protein HDU68_009478 [Siphonaria sp. JEL0065]|nr:hypothetical protein HDU68_009478 [Siphonaria sp. JEL0065]
MPSMKSVPLEVAPIAFMVVTALTFGGYVAQKEIRYGQDIRLSGPTQNADVENWQARVNKVSTKDHFPNVFYKHVTQ